LAAAGGPPLEDAPPARGAAYLQARTMVARGRLDRPLLKFGLFPLALALPAFRLHQHIAYGSAFGEYHTFGLKAYATTFAIWWAEWAMAVVLSAAALRVAIEAGSLLAVLLRPERAVDARQWLERLGLVALYIGLPMLLLLRIQ
jgi:apolipoprotein N-acyltransferase